MQPDHPNPTTTPITIETAKLEFQAGVTACLRSWSAFATAVKSQWGGVNSLQKAEDLRTNILEYFAFGKDPSKIDIYELEDNLFMYLEEEFSVVLEDESERHVAELLWNMYDGCMKGDFTLVRQTIQNAEQKSITNQKEKIVIQTEGQDDDDNSDSDEEMEIENNVCSTTAANNTHNGEALMTQDYAGEYLFGAPPGAQKPKEVILRQLGDPIPEKPQPEVDEDGFTMVPSKRKGK